MDDCFIAKPLGRRQIDQAYPLVCVAAPGLAVEQWRAFAAAVLDIGGEAGGAPAPRTGIMTVQNARGYLHGLFSYAIEEHLRHGRVMTVDNFVVLDLFDVPGVAGTLLDAMDGLARGLGCAAIHTALPERGISDRTTDNRIADCFIRGGHRRETVLLCKNLDGVNDNRAPSRRPAATPDASPGGLSGGCCDGE
ncbi:hypothetical protein ACIU1J_12940 [Azospirillum doebereinerae]|uniref:hypothetical protein n=1 Tax=Azospirillum doebereinerae TaxID=92933 RepID=UPI001EE5F758|nr:hypothetical protein [Azospirillum doebereinerae]MCG5243856.1 hypothetical protein [Azospirillum doebereinerae]